MNSWVVSQRFWLRFFSHQSSVIIITLTLPWEVAGLRNLNACKMYTVLRSTAIKRNHADLQLQNKFRTQPSLTRIVFAFSIVFPDAE